MIPPEQQIYSITESEIEEFFKYIEDENNTEEKYKNARGLLARIRIRSRPAPAAPVTCPHYELRDGAYYCGCEYDKMHDDIIASKAREEVLEELDNLRKCAHVEFEEANTSDNEREMRIHLEYENRIWDLMKQLREQSLHGGERR